MHRFFGPLFSREHRLYSTIPPFPPSSTTKMAKSTSKRRKFHRANILAFAVGASSTMRYAYLKKHWIIISRPTESPVGQRARSNCFSTIAWHSRWAGPNRTLSLKTRPQLKRMLMIGNTWNPFWGGKCVLADYSWRISRSTLHLSETMPQPEREKSLSVEHAECENHVFHHGIDTLGCTCGWRQSHGMLGIWRIVFRCLGVWCWFVWHWFFDASSITITVYEMNLFDHAMCWCVELLVRSRVGTPVNTWLNAHQPPSGLTFQWNLMFAPKSSNEPYRWDLIRFYLHVCGMRSEDVIWRTSVRQRRFVRDLVSVCCLHS